MYEAITLHREKEKDTTMRKKATYNDLQAKLGKVDADIKRWEGKLLRAARTVGKLKLQRRILLAAMVKAQGTAAMDAAERAFSFEGGAK